MPEQDDLYVAFHALQQGDITREQLLDALYALAETRVVGLPLRALGTILVEKRYLPQQRLREIIAANAMPGMIPEEASRGDSIKLGQLLAMAGIVSYAQVMEALLQQEVGREQGQPRMRLGEYLVSMGYTTPQAIQRALSYQRKAVYKCEKCQARFNVVNSQTSHAYQCIRCQGPLTPETEDVRVDGSAVVEATQEAPLPPRMTPLPVESDSFPMERVLLDRAVTHHLLVNKLVPNAALRNAEHWQMEIAQYGLHAPLLEVLRRIRLLPDETVRQIKKMQFPFVGDLRHAIPGYRITGRVTSGTCCALYTVQPQFTPGPIGLKVLHLECAADQAVLSRFKHDATLLMRFDHASLVKAYECSSAPLRDDPKKVIHYITTEFVRGTALDQLLAVKGRLPPSRAVSIAIDVAQALRYLEREGFIHGDLRGEYIFIDERHRGRLFDVGTATPLRATGKPDPRVAEDVMSLGKLLHVMLTGSPPDPGHRDPDLGSVTLSAALMDVMRTMLNPDPSRRFQRFADLVPVLQATVDRPTAAIERSA
ncbi:MAG: protein kinase [Planctomycetes bacterium]|nr:protein kinase [Planctomycetota bacterium]